MIDFYPAALKNCRAQYGVRRLACAEPPRAAALSLCLSPAHLTRAFSPIVIPSVARDPGWSQASPQSSANSTPRCVALALPLLLPAPKGTRSRLLPNCHPERCSSGLQARGILAGLKHRHSQVRTVLLGV